MKAKQTLLIALLGILTISATQAQDFISEHFVFEPETAVFEPNELSLDLFGYRGSLDKSGGNGGAWGPGAGVNYFLTQYIGFGADTYADAFTHPYLLNGNIIGRYPLGTTGLAPFGYVGIGRQWSFASQWQANLGAGVEYRFAPKTAFFTDLRGVFTGQSPDYFLWRFGFRVTF
jgi:hypothetical protein